MFTCGGIRPPGVLTLPIDKGLKKLIVMIDEHLQKNRGILLIRIAGGTASGKTTIAKRLQELFGRDVLLLSQDEYYLGLKYSQDRGLNFDQPESVDLERLKKDILSLKAGKKTEIPVYNFIEDGGKRTGYRIVEPRRVIILEGLFVLSDCLSECGGVKIFVEANRHTCVCRRLMRDIARSSWGPDENLAYMIEVVNPMHLKYVDPERNAADIVIANNYDAGSEPGSAGCAEESQTKIELDIPVSIKGLYNIGAELVSHAEQRDTYFQVAGQGSDEIVRLREVGQQITYTYKAPAKSGPIRRKAKLEFPIPPAAEKLVRASFKSVLTILKCRDVLFYRGIIFSRDSILCADGSKRYFLEIRGSAEDVETVLRALDLNDVERTAKSYYEIFLNL